MTNAVHDSSQGRQDYHTPRPLIRLVELRFNIKFVLDLAAHKDNHRMPQWIGEDRDALKLDWKTEIEVARRLEGAGVQKAAGWMNPPFRRPREFMPKCAREADAGARFATLTLADRTTEWFQLWVKPRAAVFPLVGGRVVFEGQTQGYTKGLMISLWGFGMTGTMDWDWKSDPLYELCHDGLINKTVDNTTQVP